MKKKKDENNIIKIIILIIFLISFIYSNMIMYNKIVISIGNGWNSRCSIESKTIVKQQCIEKEQIKIDKARNFIKRNEETSKYISIILMIASITLIVTSIKRKLAFRWTLLSILSIIFNIFIM